MKRIYVGLSVAILISSLASAVSAQQKVVSYSGEQITTYKKSGDNFKENGAVKVKDLPKDAQVLEISSKGYVKIAGPTPIWLDELDVKLHPPKQAATAGCDVAALNKSADGGTFGKMGIGGKGNKCY